MIRRNVDVVAAILILMAVPFVTHLPRTHVRFTNVMLRPNINIHAAVSQRACSLGTFLNDLASKR